MRKLTLIQLHIYRELHSTSCLSDSQRLFFRPALPVILPLHFPLRHLPVAVFHCSFRSCPYVRKVLSGDVHNAEDNRAENNMTEARRLIIESWAFI